MKKEPYHYKLGESDHQLIEEIIEKRPFDDIDHFIRRAIQVYLTWERDPKSTMGLFQTFPFTTEQEQFMHQSMQKQVIKDEFGHVIDVDKHDELSRQQNLRDQNNLPELRTGFPHTLSALNDFKPIDITNQLTENDLELKYDYYPLIWRFYSRFLPTKIALIVLADIIVRTKNLLVPMEQFKDEAYDIAEELVQEIEQYEKKARLKRNEKISTGFPTIEKDKERQYVTQKRFKDQYIGKKKIHKETREITYEGAMMALGLIHVLERGGEIFATLTKLGMEFVKISNPVFNEDYSKAFSDQESEFIMNKIMPQRELENELVKESLKKIKTFNEKSNSTKELDDLFLQVITEYAGKKSKFSEKFIKQVTDHKQLQKTDPKKQTPIMAFRVATMGRLAELGVIDWKIGDYGKSRFSIPTKALTN